MLRGERVIAISSISPPQKINNSRRKIESLTSYMNKKSEFAARGVKAWSIFHIFFLFWIWNLFPKWYFKEPLTKNMSNKMCNAPQKHKDWTKS